MKTTPADQHQIETEHLDAIERSNEQRERQLNTRAGEASGRKWVNYGRYQSLRFAQGEIVLEQRPVYCDRGNFLAKCFPKGDLILDGQDGWPHYYFDEDRAKAEIEAWLDKRKL